MLPAPGKPIRYLTASLPVVLHDDPRVFAALLEALQRAAGRYSFCCLAFMSPTLCSRWCGAGRPPGTRHGSIWRAGTTAKNCGVGWTAGPLTWNWVACKSENRSHASRAGGQARPVFVPSGLCIS